jgi:hypothetical protein
MKQLSPIFVVALLLALTHALPASAEGSESWIFRRSYYSHDPTESVRIGRQYVGSSPAFSRPSGSYVRGGWRWQNAPIIIGGQMYDNYNYYEAWSQQGQQF